VTDVRKDSGEWRGHGSFASLYGNIVALTASVGGKIMCHVRTVLVNVELEHCILVTNHHRLFIRILSRVEKIHRFGAKYIILFRAGYGSRYADLLFSLWMGLLA
jgi:hypothetical protein